MTGFPDGPRVPDRPDDHGGPGAPGGSGHHGDGDPGGRADSFDPFSRTDRIDRLGGIDDPEGEAAPDPVERLMRPPGGYLAAPPGSFERIRRRAARRRTVRALAGGGVAAAVIAGALFVTGVIDPGGNGDEVVGPPASNSLTGTPTPSGTPTARPSGTPAPGTGSSHTPATATPTTPTSGATTGNAGAPSTAPTGGDTTPMCAASQLSAALGGSDAGAGNLYRYLVVTNTGSTACHLTGYPGLSMLDANGQQIGQPATRKPMDYSPVVLKPGGTASDTIHTANQQGTCLPASAQLKMYPPGSKASLKFTGQITECADMFEITPFIAGETGNPPS